MSSSVLLVFSAFALFWVAMLGLLWRRSLVGMLVGVLFGWLSVALLVVGFSFVHADPAKALSGATLIFCAALIGALQVALGLSVIVARVSRRGTLDAQDAGLLEG